MKYDKFFQLAKEAGIEDAELYINQSYNLSFSLFHSEVDNYSCSNGFSIVARGLFNGKFGVATCDTWNAAKAEYLVKEIVTNAKLSENDDPVFIFAGSPKYKKINIFNKDLEKVSIDDKKAALFKLEKLIKDGDSKISEVEEVGYEESKGSTTLMNSKGLKLNQKSNYFVIYGVALAKENDQTKSNFEIFFDNDFSKFNVEGLAKKITKGAVEQLNGEPCETGKYKTVLAPEAFRHLLNFYIGQADAEEVQKKSSLFIDKLNQKVASKKVTVNDMPLSKSLFARPFDDEGVATSNRAIIKNGVLQTYFYNLTTAAKDGVETTGNGQRAGSTIGAGPFYLVLKPGKKSQEQLFEEVQDGVYITSLSGLHSGLNPQSGNFSLVASGFLIKDGKKSRALDMITVSGNLQILFNDIVEIGNDVKTFPSAISCPSVVVKKLAITGK